MAASRGLTACLRAKRKVDGILVSAEVRLVRACGIVIGLLAVVLLVARTLSLESVPSDEIRDALGHSAIGSMQESRLEPVSNMPLLISIRFGARGSKGGTGITDRTDVYRLSTSTGEVTVRAHVRGDQVCCVAVGGPGDTYGICDVFHSRFPRLWIKQMD